MIRDDAMGEREPDPMPFGLCGEEGNEDALQVSRRDAIARVTDLDDGPIFARHISFMRSQHRNAALSFIFVNGFGGVA